MFSLQPPRHTPTLPISDAELRDRHERTCFDTGHQRGQLLAASGCRSHRRSAASPRRRVLHNDRTPRLTGVAPAPGQLRPPALQKKIVGGASRQGRHHAPSKEYGQRGSVMIELPVGRAEVSEGRGSKGGHRPASIPKINLTLGRCAIIAWRCPVSSGASYEISTP
jgi:hypothetical protein